MVFIFWVDGMNKNGFVTLQYFVSYRMGWHINYEVEFGDYVDFDIDDVEDKLKDDGIISDVKLMLLRDYAKPRCIVCVYSHTSIEQVLSILLDLYNTPITYRMYGEEIEWRTYTKTK
jgi:hypothetical protein